MDPSSGLIKSQQPYVNVNMSNSSSLSSSLVSLNSTLGTSQQVSPVTLNLSSTHTTYRDSRWLKLHVCPSILPGSSDHHKNNNNSNSNNIDTKTGDGNSKDVADKFFCTLLGDLCPYAHPPSNVRIDKVHVTVCYDYIKVIKTLFY